mmetsp:Transcript_14327/g.26031  ORF Transcript_14327/g.26031 Transcript_14327/m.26031 type:complete len:304 (-) Transcript_14327:86-997(-)
MHSRKPAGDSRKPPRPFEACGLSLLGSQAPATSFGGVPGAAARSRAGALSPAPERDDDEALWSRQVRASIKNRGPSPLPRHGASFGAGSSRSTADEILGLRPAQRIGYSGVRLPSAGAGGASSAHVEHERHEMQDVSRGVDMDLRAGSGCRSYSPVDLNGGIFHRSSAGSPAPRRFSGILDGYDLQDRSGCSSRCDSALGIYSIIPEPKAVPERRAGAEALQRARGAAKARMAACFEDLISFLEMHSLTGAYALAFAANGIQDLSQLLLLSEDEFCSLVARCDVDAMDEIILRDAMRKATVSR